MYVLKIPLSGSREFFFSTIYIMATTKKGDKRKGAKMTGSRLAFDDTKQEKNKMMKKGGGINSWRNAVKKANAKLGTTGVAPKKGSKAYVMAKSMM